MRSNWKVGQRIQVKQPDAGKDWHFCDGVPYTRECEPGDKGVITAVGEMSERVPGVEILAVTWDHKRNSRIDETCIELEENEAELDAEALRLFGVAPPKTLNHCKTCTCTD